MTDRQESVAKRTALLALKVLGGACWVAAYREAITETEEEGTELLPEAALAFNLAWEAIYSSGGIWTWRKLSLEDRVQTIINISWLVYDVKWLQAVRRHGTHVRPGLIAMAVTYQLAFLSRLPPGEAARISALWQNLGFSAYSALTEAQVDERASKFALLRAVGTAVPTVTSGILRGVEPRYLTPGLGCVAFDLLRISRNGRERGWPFSR
ncbi:hypothetical protein [Streptomyces pacificus]|uniref:Uncharacterized protein n=1 Tax=Streptomyces pacificus TaxID=2705029 RepID=A0A6A0AWE1_9ACTN|nr:hypothetical protein [Streptomyces pacificus]GFH37216.1 hypothetical protein SCWH03_34520 [Streptomyces pacificus]